jgi:hypothetical protein
MMDMSKGRQGVNRISMLNQKQRVTHTQFSVIDSKGGQRTFIIDFIGGHWYFLVVKNTKVDLTERTIAILKDFLDASQE